MRCGAAKCLFLFQMTSRMNRLFLPVIALAAASLAGDALCRSLARGGDPERLLQMASENLTRLPEQIGPWRSTKAEPLSDDVLQMLDCRAHEARIYVNDETGETVGLMLLAGAAGPLVSHTAEVCYGSAAYEIVEPPASQKIRGSGDEADTVHSVTFRSHSVNGQTQRVYYAWRRFEGPWQAPANPRMALGGQPMLYKLQLAGEAPPEGTASAESDSARRFLVDLLPALDKALAAPH